jgi:hypothetical protein
VASQLARFEFTGFFDLTLHAGSTKELYKYQILPDFKKVILRIWVTIVSNDVMRAACNAFKKRLRLVVKAKGQSIENNNFFYSQIYNFN